MGLSEAPKPWIYVIFINLDGKYDGCNLVQTTRRLDFGFQKSRK